MGQSLLLLLIEDLGLGYGSRGRGGGSGYRGLIGGDGLHFLIWEKNVTVKGVVSGRLTGPKAASLYNFAYCLSLLSRFCM